MSPLPVIQGFLASEKSGEKHPLILRKALDGMSYENLTDGKHGQWPFSHTDWAGSVLREGEFLLHSRANTDQWLVITDPELIKWLVTFSRANGRKYQTQGIIWRPFMKRLVNIASGLLALFILWQVFLIVIAPRLGLHLSATSLIAIPNLE